MTLDGGLGVAVCKDLDFQDVAEAYVGARALLVPAWDFGRDAELHRRMAVIRAIEGGFALVRAARDGSLSVHDAWGNLVAERRSDADAVSLLVANLPLSGRRTAFPWLARWFGIGAIVLALALGALATWRARSPSV